MIQIHVNDEYTINSWLKANNGKIEVISTSFVLDNDQTAIVMVTYKVK